MKKKHKVLKKCDYMTAFFANSCSIRSFKFDCVALFFRWIMNKGRLNGYYLFFLFRSMFVLCCHCWKCKMLFVHTTLCFKWLVSKNTTCFNLSMGIVSKYIIDALTLAISCFNPYAFESILNCAYLTINAREHHADCLNYANFVTHSN